MRFTYQLSNHQEFMHPAFFVHHIDRKPRVTNFPEILRAVQQLRSGADILVKATDDQVATGTLIHELTFRCVQVANGDKSMPLPQRTIPGHLFILYPGTDNPTKIW